MILATIAAFGVVTGGFSVPRIDMDALLLAIARAETSNKEHPDGDDHRIGRAGERSRYQITRGVWEQVTTVPFTYAIFPDAAAHVARRHLEWLERKLHALPGAPAFVIALAWNAGPHAVLANYANQQQRDYAARVEAIYRQIIDAKKIIIP